jgi:glycosyltransferase involved in cell wall biosynthesis
VNEDSLLLITHNYPYGSGEPFLEMEIQYLSVAFNEIVIISKNVTDEKSREVPKNVILHRYNPKSNFIERLFFPILLLTNLEMVVKDFFYELKLTKKVYGLQMDFSRIKVLFHFIGKGLQLSDFIIRNVLKERNFSVAYSYWLDNSAYALRILKKRESNLLKCISRAHSGELYNNRSSVQYQPLQHAMMKNLDQIYFISENGRKYFQNKQKTGIVLSKLKLSRLGVDNSYKREFPIDIKKFILVSCSNVNSVKRIDLIIEALSLVRDEKIKWIHIGDGPLLVHSLDLANDLLKNNPSVDYCFLGKKSNKEIYDFYYDNEISVLINVSISEGIPVSVMEAFSFGIPTIATNVGGTSELVNNLNGILLSSSPSPNEVFNAIKKLYYLPDNLFSKFREKAFLTWRDHFKAKTNYSEFVNMILEL